MAETTIQAAEIASEFPTLGYAQATADQTAISSAVAVTNCSVTVTVPAGGKRIQVTGQLTWDSDGASQLAVMNLQEDTVTKNSIYQQNDTAFDYQTIGGSVVFTPSAGSHTYRLTFARSRGASTINIRAGASLPSFILVELA